MEKVNNIIAVNRLFFRRGDCLKARLKADLFFINRRKNVCVFMIGFVGKSLWRRI